LANVNTIIGSLREEFAEAVFSSPIKRTLKINRIMNESNVPLFLYVLMTEKRQEIIIEERLNIITTKDPIYRVLKLLIVILQKHLSRYLSDEK